MDVSNTFASIFVDLNSKTTKRSLEYVIDDEIKLLTAKIGKAKKKPRPKPTKKLPRSVLQRKGLYAIPDGTIRYEEAVPLHAMWCEYIDQMLNNENTSKRRHDSTSFENRLMLKADYHGAKVLVVRSKQSSVLGIKGIVIMDTKNTFKIVSKDNKIRTIPKIDSVFQVITGKFVITIFGQSLCFRPHERSARNKKRLPMNDL